MWQVVEKLLGLQSLTALAVNQLALAKRQPTEASPSKLESAIHAEHAGKLLVQPCSSDVSQTENTPANAQLAFSQSDWRNDLLHRFPSSLLSHAVSFLSKRQTSCVQ